MDNEKLQREYERFKEECLKLTAENTALSKENGMLKNMNERFLKIIENLTERTNRFE